MELSKNISFSQRALTTPPDSPMKETAKSQATVKALKHLFGVVLEKMLLYLTDREPPNTPVSQDQSPSGLDMLQLKKLLVKLTHDELSLAELSVASKPTKTCSATNKQENVPAPDGFDLQNHICTPPDDFKSFEKWASTPQFKTVVETYELSTPFVIPS